MIVFLSLEVDEVSSEQDWLLAELASMTAVVALFGFAIAVARVLTLPGWQPWLLIVRIKSLLCHVVAAATQLPSNLINMNKIDWI